MNINIVDQQSSLAIETNAVEVLVHAVLDFEGCSCDEVSIIFVDVAKICQLHEQFFQDPSPTDCISFPLDRHQEGSYWILGEVFVCPEVAIDYVKEHGGDPYDETILYLVHGLLHLLGHDDITEKERKRMRVAEQRNLQNLKALNVTLT